MEINLKNYMDIHGLTNILMAKYHLFEFKKRGLLFFKEEIAELQLDDTFQIYYYLSSNKGSSRDAFPIPKHRFILPKCNAECYESMKKHFEDYYLEAELDKEGFGEFDLKNPYIGEDYVWVYKRTS